MAAADVSEIAAVPLPPAPLLLVAVLVAVVLEMLSLELDWVPAGLLEAGASPVPGSLHPKGMPSQTK